MGHESIQELYERYGPVVFRRARLLLRDEAAAWDALQEVFVRALRHRSSFRQEAELTTWLYRITTNHCFNVLRDTARRREKLRQEGPPPGTSAAGGPELQIIVAQILDRLPVDLAEIAVYHHVDQMSHEEIAEILGVSRRTVGNRLKEFHARADALLGRKLEVPA